MSQHFDFYETLHTWREEQIDDLIDKYTDDTEKRMRIKEKYDSVVCDDEMGEFEKWTENQFRTYCDAMNDEAYDRSIGN